MVVVVKVKKHGTSSKLRHHVDMFTIVCSTKH